jgi:hypothetical protein
MIKRLLKKYGNPPDKTAMATDLVLEQAEVLSSKWTDEEDIKKLERRVKKDEKLIADSSKQKKNLK